MRTTVAVLTSVAVVLGVVQSSSGEADYRIGVGAHYWRSLQDIEQKLLDSEDEPVESDLAWVGVLQIRPMGLIGVEGAVEYMPGGVGPATEQTFAPQAHLLLGGKLYAGVGVGILYADGDFSDGFYCLRAGTNVGLLGVLYVDVHAQYRFVDWGSLSSDDFTTSTITLGATALIQF